MFKSCFMTRQKTKRKGKHHEPSLFPCLVVHPTDPKWVSSPQLCSWIKPTHIPVFWVGWTNPPTRFVRWATKCRPDGFPKVWDWLKPPTSTIEMDMSNKQNRTTHINYHQPAFAQFVLGYKHHLQIFIGGWTYLTCLKIHCLSGKRRNSLLLNTAHLWVDLLCKNGVFP